MALALFDRVQETTTTTGTGSVTLAGAVPGFQTFAVVGNGNTCYYTIVDGSAWEVGVGTYSTSGPTLARTTILSNSNGNVSPITLTAGVKSIFLTYPAGKSVNLNESGNVSPLGTVVSGIWNGTTIGVAYGGTGVTASSGANSVVLRDSDQNIAVNRVSQSNTNTTAAGGTTALTAASSYIHTLVGTGGQTYTLPDATTLTTGVAFVFNNLATGTLTLANYAGTTIGTIPSGGAGASFLTLNSTVGGTWDLHAYLPEGVTFGTNAFNLGTSIISGGTWQGGTIATGYGGTGLTTYTSGGAVYANSSSTLTSGTLPITAGGTGNTSGQAASTAFSATFNSGGAGDASGTTFNGSAARTISYNTIGAPSTTGTNASGTWGINITGNAATATTATTATNQSGGTVNATTGAFSGQLTVNNVAYFNAGTGVADFNDVNLGGVGGWSANESHGINTYYGSVASPTIFTRVDSQFVGTTAVMRWKNFYSGGPQTSTIMTLTSTGASTATLNVVGNITLSGSQVLTAGNYNSYAPTLTGGGASGTWGINITGSAASATSASTSTTQGKTNASTSIATTSFSKWLFATTSTAGTLDWNDQSNTIPGVGTTLLLGTAANGPGGGNYYHPFTIEYASNDGTGQVTQMAIAYGSPGNELYMRGRYTGSWSGWVRYLNSNNYNSFSPTLTGTGASGTWGIRITGFANAGTPRLYASDSPYTFDGAAPYYLYMTYDGTRWLLQASPATPAAVRVAYSDNSGALGGYGPNQSGGANTIVQRDANGYIQNNYFYTSGGGSERNASGMGYFAGFNSSDYYIRSYTPAAVASAISGQAMNISGSATSATFLNSSNYINQTGNTGTWNSDFQNTPAGTARYGGDVGAQATNNPGGSWWIQQNFRHTNSSNYWGTQVAWGWEDNANRLATRNVQGGTFGSWVYYLNNSNVTTYMDAPNKAGTSYYQVQTWLQMNGTHGLYWPSYYGLHIYPNVSSTYTQMQIDGSKNSYSGMFISHSGVNGMMYDGNGNGGVYREANGRWYFYHLVSDNCMGIGTSTTNSAYGVYVIKGVYSEGNVVAYSDERVKTNWRDYPADFVEQLAKVKHGTYDRTDMELTQDGVSAQSLQKLLPYSAPVDKNDRLAVNYGGAALVSAVELAKYVTALEQRIKQLEARL